ncbi:MAG: DUF788 domain-containing protein [Simkaniaceae bacterium]|nr:DUF788 domain-containing protein [Simkaniaceae bacterium]
MSTQPQKLNWFFKKFENSPNLHALKTISRLVGLVSLLVVLLTTHDLFYALTALAVSILSTDTFFFFKGMEESKYKTKKALKSMGINKESMNTYNDLLLVTKGVVFLLSLFFMNGIIYYGVFAIIAPLFIAHVAGYKPWIGDKTQQSAFADSTVQNSSSNQNYEITRTEETSYSPYPIYPTAISNLGMFTGGDHFSSSSH